MTTPEEHVREMIADRLNEYQTHHANAAGLLMSAEDPSCDCEPAECECPDPWERGEYIAAAQAEATLAQAAATAMAALVRLVEKTSK